MALLLCGADVAAQPLPADRVYVEFARPVRVPGATLPPGMYLFVIGTPVGGQNILDVYSADGARLAATCLTIETALPRPRTSTTIDFPALSPSALRAWFHPANLIGLEFVYSSAEARGLFAETGLWPPNAPFKPTNRDLVGAFPISRALAMATVSRAKAAPVATSGTVVIAAGDGLGPHDHLTTARRLIVNRRRDAGERERVLLDALKSLVVELQSSYRRGDRDASRRALRAIEASLSNVTPTARELATGKRTAPPRGLTIALEQVGAHVRAFTASLPRVD